jgi:dihydrofolate reductase
VELAAGVLDEIELHLVPVLFGQGRRLFEDLAPKQVELERTRILEGEGGLTHLHYRSSAEMSATATRAVRWSRASATQASPCLRSALSVPSHL